MDLNLIFKERLLEAMNSKGITQRNLAQRARVTEAAISKYVNEGRVPRMEIIANIATALHTTVDYLLGRDENNEFDFLGVKNLLARNAGNMSSKEKMELVKILFDNN